MQELFFYVELGCSLRFGRSFCLSLLYTVVYVINCTDLTAYLICLSVSFQISLIVSLSESFCWSVYISVCTCVSLLLCVESRRRCRLGTTEASCRAQECSLSCAGSDEWTLHALDKIDKRLEVAIVLACTGTERGNAMAARATRTREVAETESTQGMCWRFVRS